MDENAPDPKFNASIQSGECPNTNGIVVYYSNRCPFAEFHAKESLVTTAKNRNLPLEIIKLKTMEEAQNCPSPATIFSMFLNGKFVTTDLSVCMDTRYDKVIAKALK
ncbi:YoaP domain-containing protein [Kordia sp. SMS9]|uniref:YoaP domain-containing protein n=1 Tax=Kordia sp. SMS9 TaxID=2282170 RepID=UPI001F07E6C7|nr:YoaP domain-containing protein [Kordia sp. SMS9]